MNDSCKYRVSRGQILNNRVFPLEDPKTFLHVSLALTPGVCTCEGECKYRKSSKINEKEVNLARQLATAILHGVGNEYPQGAPYAISANVEIERPRLNDWEFAVSARRRGPIRRALQALLQVHERQESCQDPLLVFVGKPLAADCNPGEFVRRGAHPVGNFGLAGRRGLAYRDFPAQFRAVMFDRRQEVLDAKDFCFKLLRNGNLAPAQAGRTGHSGRHTDPLLCQ